jgi:peroxiredoxin
VDRVAGNALKVTRRIGIGTWSFEFFRRSTFLVDAHGVVAAVWGAVKVRGHAREVLKAGKLLGHLA